MKINHDPESLANIESERGRVDNLVILLMGKKRVGKNTAAQVIKREIESRIEVSVGADGEVDKGFVVREFAFASELRYHLSILNPIVSLTGNYRWNDALEKYGYETAKEKFPEMRRLMEIYGTQVIRERVSENYWANKLLREIEDFNSGANEAGYRTVSIVTDCRFPNELDVFDYGSYLGGTVEVVGIERSDVDDGDNHASNAGLNAIFVTKNKSISILRIIDNNGDLEQFDGVIRKTWQCIKNRKEILRSRY